MDPGSNPGRYLFENAVAGSPWPSGSGIRRESSGPRSATVWPGPWVCNGWCCGNWFSFRIRQSPSAKHKSLKHKKPKRTSPNLLVPKGIFNTYCFCNDLMRLLSARVLLNLVFRFFLSHLEFVFLVDLWSSLFQFCGDFELAVRFFRAKVFLVELSREIQIDIWRQI